MYMRHYSWSMRGNFGKKLKPKTDIIHCFRQSSAVVISACDMLMIYTCTVLHYSTMALCKYKRRKNIPWKKTNSGFGLIRLPSIRYIHPNDPTNDLTEHYLQLNRQFKNILLYIF